MKKYLFLVLAVALFFACEKDDENEYSAIKLGTGDKTLSDISLNKFTERKIILSGGNNKFNVSIADSKIAEATVFRDTLKIKALLEGKTVASIKSHSQEVFLTVNVIPQEISISQDSIRLYPTDFSKFVSVNGGGEIVEMEEIDPEDILDAKWNGETGILELKAHFEGDATIRFKSKNVVSKAIKVTVKSEGNPDKIGIYSTQSKSIYAGLQPVMFVKRKNIGTWLSASTNPYGVAQSLNKKIVVKFPSLKRPQEGIYMDINASFYPYVNGVSNMGNGKNRVYVQKVNEDEKTILFRGRGFRLILPFIE